MPPFTNAYRTSMMFRSLECGTKNSSRSQIPTHVAKPLVYARQELMCHSCVRVMVW